MRCHRKKYPKLDAISCSTHGKTGKMATDSSRRQKKTLGDLGGDLIAAEIIPKLSPRDIQALGSTCHYLHDITNESGVWHQMFTKTFGMAPTPFVLSQYKWPDLYKLRKSAKLATWGSVAGGRLGYRLQDVPQSSISRHGPFQAGVSRPHLVAKLQDTTLADVSAGGYSFQILTSDGELYTTGTAWHGLLLGTPGPAVADDISDPAREPPTPTTPAAATSRFPAMGWLDPFRLGPVIPRTEGVPPPPRPGRAVEHPLPQVTTPAQDDPAPEPIETVTKPQQASGYLSKLDAPCRFVSVSSSRAHFVALDDSGQVWTWDNRGQRLSGLKLKFSKPGGSSLITDQNIVTKIVAGWDSSCCLIYNVGIVYWTSRDRYQGARVDIADHPVEAHYKVVRHTGASSGPDRVVDIVAGESFLVYLTSAGRIYRFDLNEEAAVPFELDRFASFLRRHSISSSSKFVRLSGGYRTFSAISDEDHVLIGSKDSLTPEVIPELQKKGIISTAVGDYHYLALTKDGELLSWGLEPRACGCLGLGTTHDGTTTFYDGERVGAHEFKVTKPTKVEVDGKVLAIGAAGWQSCAIVSV